MGRDPIQWREHPIGDLYKKLFALKKKNTTLWNGHWGAIMIKVPNDAPAQVLSFVRQNDQDKVLAVLNFSDQARKVTLQEGLYPGRYTDYFGGEKVELTGAGQVGLRPWGYRVFVK